MHVFFFFTGITCDVKQVYSQPNVIQRILDQMPDEATKLDEAIQEVIDQIHSLSAHTDNPRTFTASSTGDSFSLSGYFSVLNNLYAVFQPLLKGGFIDDLPKTVVCLLSGRQDCGLGAELTKTVSLELGKPLLTFVSSLRSQTCPISSESQTNSIFGYYLRMGESTTGTSGDFQSTFMNVLSSIPLSGSLVSALNGLVDSAAVYLSQFLATLLQVPMDYIKIALQFGIKIPSLDGTETCAEGKTFEFLF